MRVLHRTAESCRELLATATASCERITIMAFKVELEPEFVELFTEFLERFENVFDADWDVTKSRLDSGFISYFIHESGTFLDPQVDDEFSNWACRGSLLEAYRKLKCRLEDHEKSLVHWRTCSIDEAD